MAKEIANFEQLKVTTLGWFKEGADDGWIYTEGYPGSVCSQKHMNPWPIDSFRVSGEVPKSPKDASDTLWSWKTEDWKKFSADSELLEIKEDTGDEQVLFQVLALTWPLWYRDMIVHRKRFTLEDGSILFIIASSKELEEKYPCDTSKYQRASCNADVLLFQPIADKPNACIASRVINFDPAGSLPSTVVNLLAKANVFNFPHILREFWK